MGVSVEMAVAQGATSMRASDLRFRSLRLFSRSGMAGVQLFGPRKPSLGSRISNSEELQA